MSYCGKIKIFFSEEEDLDRLNNLLEKQDFYKQVGPDRILELNSAEYNDGFGGIQLYINRPPFQPIPFGFSYDSIIWIKDADGKILWQNFHYNNDGSLKTKK